MPTFAYITKVTLTSPAATVSLTNIPQTYDDLVLLTAVFTGGVINSTSEFRPNNNTTNLTSIGSSSSNVATNGFTDTTMIFGIVGAPDGGTAYCRSNDVYWIPNYTSSDHKITLYQNSYNRNSATQIWYVQGGGLSANSGALTSITFGTNGSNIAAGTSLYLYGIKNA